MYSFPRQKSVDYLWSIIGSIKGGLSTSVRRDEHLEDGRKCRKKEGSCHQEAYRQHTK